MSPLASWIFIILVAGFALGAWLHFDAKAWKDRYEPDEKRRDRIDTELDDLRRLEEWRDALERMHDEKHIRIGHKKRKKEKE
jgi:hypothetical protein